MVTAENSNTIHPKKFMLWVALGTILMMFAGLTSAYIVRQAQGNWTAYQLPKIFWLSTAVIILSSITMTLAVQYEKKSQQPKYRTALTTTFLLGIAFAVLQVIGWKELSSSGILLAGRDPSGAFLYVISGIHALHVVGGLVFIGIFWIKTYLKRDPIQQLLYDTNPEKHIGIELLSTYWHFIGILWIYLFVFFNYFK